MSSDRSATNHGSAPDGPPVDAPPAVDRRPGWVRRRPALATKANYAAIYGVDGVLLPFFSVYLAHVHGLNTTQIGFVLAAASVAALVAPPIVSMLADRFGHAERLLMLTLLAGAVALFVFNFVDGYWWVLGCYFVFSLAREPGRPLLDGIFFNAQRTIPALGSQTYHGVRLWGTFGFMVPGVALYFVVSDNESLIVLPWLACVLAVAAIVAAYFLPTRDYPTLDSGTAQVRQQTSMRDLFRAIGRLVRRPTTAMFIVAMFLLNASMAAYAAFYPLQFTDVVGLSPRWLGPVNSIGVGLELVYMAAFGWFVRHLGWRKLMVIGALAAAARVALLAAVPTVAVVVGTQVVHGLVIIVTMVAGRIIMDRQAPDEIRHSAQGLYAMAVVGGGRIAGTAVGGLVAAGQLSTVFWASSGAALVAAGILAWALRQRDDVPSTL